MEDEHRLLARKFSKIEYVHGLLLYLENNFLNPSPPPFTKGRKSNSSPFNKGGLRGILKEGLIYHVEASL
jgi:hypothetical protein